MCWGVVIGFEGRKINTLERTGTRGAIITILYLLSRTIKEQMNVVKKFPEKKATDPLIKFVRAGAGVSSVGDQVARNLGSGQGLGMRF